MEAAHEKTVDGKVILLSLKKSKSAGVSLAAHFWSSLRAVSLNTSLVPDTKICAASLAYSNFLSGRSISQLVYAEKNY